MFCFVSILFTNDDDDGRRRRLKQKLHEKETQLDQENLIINPRKSSNQPLAPTAAVELIPITAIRSDAPSPAVPNLLDSLCLYQEDASQETQGLAMAIAIDCFQLRCSI